MAITNNYPWDGIEVPIQSNQFTAKRVDASLTWSFFWAVDAANRCMFVLHHATESEPNRSLPSLAGIEISSTSGDEENEPAITFTLSERSNRGMFLQLCEDLIASTDGLNTEREAVAMVVGRTWRWHHLLRGGSSGLLTLEEQQGLIGELFALEKLLLSSLSKSDAVAAWRGPLGAPKDFEVDQTALEVKSRRGASAASVRISSEHQLDETGVDSLFLFVISIDRATEGAENSFTLPDLASRIQHEIGVSDFAAQLEFMERLSAAGLRPEDDYSEHVWLEGSHAIYEVRESFPRLTAGSIGGGISNVTYDLALSACAQFVKTDQDFMDEIGRSRNGN